MVSITSAILYGAGICRYFRDDGARDKTPVELRFPHNSKKWGLGVGQVPGERALEGVFAIGKVAKADGVIFHGLSTHLPALTIRLLPKVGPDKVQNTGQYGAAATTKTKGQPPDGLLKGTSGASESSQSPP